MNQTEKKKKAIIDVTFSLLNEKEIKDITVEEIAGAAEVSKVTLFKYYQNKNHLMNLVIIKALDFMAAQAQELIDSDLNFEETLHAITDMKVGQIKKFSQTFMQNLMTQYSENPALFDTDAQLLQQQMIKQLFQKGRKEGEIASDISEEEFLLIIRIFSEGVKGLDPDYLLSKTNLLSRTFLNGLK